MAKKRVVTVPINGEALRKELKRLNVTMVAVSKAIGFEQSYIHHVIRNNKIQKAATKLLQMMYGIDPDIYLIKEEEPKKVEQPVEIVQSAELTDDMKQDLYKIIYSAVYEAVKKAWTE